MYRSLLHYWWVGVYRGVRRALATLRDNGIEVHWTRPLTEKTGDHGEE